MNKKTNILFVNISIVFLLSCNEYKYRETRLFSMSDIQKKIYLTGEVIELDEIVRPRNLFLKDSLLFTVNMRKDHGITVFCLPEMKKIGDFLLFGSGPNEVLDVDNLQFQDSFVWTSDRDRHQVNKYSLTQYLKENEAKPLEIIKIEESFEHLLIAPDKLITNSLHHIRSRFSFYDLQGNFIENKGNLPDAGIQMTDLELYESNFCNMVLNPSNGSIFIAYKNTDLIEIYDSDGHIKTRIHGPDQFYSIKKESSSGDMQSVRSIEGKTRDAYFSPVAFEDEIWTVYDGKYFDRTAENSFLCNHIIVFDWDGNPIRQYITDIPFYSLAIDRVNSIIYGITLNPEFSIVKFNY